MKLRAQLYLIVICSSVVLAGCRQRDRASESELTANQEIDKRTSEQQDEYDRRAKRGEALMAEHERLLKKEEEHSARFEKILDTWERQQQQYQAYLDSLRSDRPPH